MNHLNDDELPQEIHEAQASEREFAEVRELLRMVCELSGMDFQDYTHASVARRVLRRVQIEGTETVSGLRHLVQRDLAARERLLLALTLPVTSMFRDPGFFRAFREHAVPMLRTHPFLRLWVAGCSTGQEVYSLAILLHEEGLYKRSRIYATDLQAAAIDQAASGIFPLSAMQEYTQNYQEAGGRRTFSEYYTADRDAVILRSFLRSNVVFAVHNLVSDSSFNEFQVIFCRNVMIYFNPNLRDRVHRLLHGSLMNFGYLGLGRSESLHYSPLADHYEEISGRERLFRKIR